MVPGSSLV